MTINKYFILLKIESITIKKSSPNGESIATNKNINLLALIYQKKIWVRLNGLTRYQSTYL